jgi:prevent-host-death family protein
MAHSITASDLKAHCARVIDDVAKRRATVIVTKHGRPVAKIVPLPAKRGGLFGFARGMLTVRGDIVQPVDVEWESAR